MAKLFVLNDLKQFEAWLKTQPREVCIAIAARVALRVVPLVAFDLQTKGEILLSPSEVSRNIALPVMRAVALTLAAVKYPAKVEVLIPFASSVANGSAIARAAVVDAVHSPVLKPKDSAFYDDAAIAAARVAARWAMLHKDAVLYDRIAPAHFAAEAAAASANASADAVGADVAPIVFSAAGRAVTFSIRAMELTGTNAGATYASDAQVIVSGGTIQGLIGTPLWPQGTPEWALQNWRDLRRTLNAERQDWDVWTRWYDAVLEGRPTPGGEDLDIYRVTLDGEEDWKKGPAHVNALIKKKEEELAERSAATLPPLDLTQYPASFVFNIVDGQLVASPLTGGEGELSDADDIRTELIGKLKATADRLAKTQCIPRYPETLRQAANLLESSASSGLPAGKVLMAFRSIEADATAITSPEGKAEFASDVISAVEDVLRSFEDFKAQLPNIIKLETNRLALQLATSDAGAVNAEIEKLAKVAAHIDIVSVSANQALAEGSFDFGRHQQTIETSHNTMEIAAAREAQAAVVAQRSMVVRNFVARPLKFVAEKTFSGIGKGIEKSVEAMTVVAIAGIVSMIAGNIAGIAVYLATFRPLSKKVDEIANRNPADDIAET